MPSNYVTHKDAGEHITMRTMRGCSGWLALYFFNQASPEGREDGVEETSLHWLRCKAYTGLRHGMDPELVLKDRIVFIRRVQELRKTLEARI